jgi:hypothetical protein
LLAVHLWLRLPLRIPWRCCEGERLRSSCCGGCGWRVSAERAHDNMQRWQDANVRHLEAPSM